MTNYYPRVDVWRIPAEALAASFREMARDGALGNEGVALWLGQRREAVAHVSCVVILRDPRVIRQPDLMSIPPEVLNDVADVAINRELVLVGQIHSHATRHGVGLSPTDRFHGVAVPYYLSVVAPNYGLGAMPKITSFGVHVFEPKMGYRRMPAAEVLQRIHVAVGEAVEVVTVPGQSG